MQVRSPESRYLELGLSQTGWCYSKDCCTQRNNAVSRCPVCIGHVEETDPCLYCNQNSLLFYRSRHNTWVLFSFKWSILENSSSASRDSIKYLRYSCFINVCVPFPSSFLLAFSVTLRTSAATSAAVLTRTSKMILQACFALSTNTTFVDCGADLCSQDLSWRITLSLTWSAVVKT